MFKPNVLGMLYLGSFVVVKVPEGVSGSRYSPYLPEVRSSSRHPANPFLVGIMYYGRLHCQN